MPRNGSGVYSHPFPDVVEGTTIESAVFNGNTSDVEQDLNTPRPIVAGGTGANNAHDALINLHGEESGQVVTNYDSFPFVSGSFMSAAGATSAPVAGHAFAGICYVYSSPDYIVIEARDYNDTNPGPLYVRQKFVGAWGPWAKQAGSTADLDAAYVNVAGDTMTGGLNISTPGNSVLNLISPVPSINVLRGMKGAGLARWEMYLGNSSGESGGNAGSDFQLVRVDDTGTANIGSAVVINRATGAWTMNGTISMTGTAGIGGNLTVTGTVTSSAKGHTFGQPGGTGATAAMPAADANLFIYNFGGSNWAGMGADGGGNMWFKAGIAGTPKPALWLNAADYSVNANYNVNVAGSLTTGGNISAAGDLYAGNTGPGGVVRFGNAGTAYMYWNGSAHTLAGGTLNVGGAINAGAYGITATSLTLGAFTAGAQNIVKAGCLIDSAGGRGFTTNIGAVADSGPGYCDVTYDRAYGSPSPSVSVTGQSTNVTCSTGLIVTTSCRCHCITATTGALTDPVYYSFTLMAS